MKNGFRRPLVLLSLTLAALVAGGCASLPAPAPVKLPPVSDRPFALSTDALAFANELDWIYRLDPATGKMDFTRVEPEPDYIHRCFVLVRSAKQFFLHARFDPAAARADAGTYRSLIRQVLARSVRDTQADTQRIVIPGYADLRSFSTAWPTLFKEEAGGSWRSYVQTGNWRMVFPFSRRHQQAMAEQLLSEIHQNLPPIVHMVRFPVITINHAVLLYAAKETDKEILFAVYDPNHPEAPGELTYDRASRTFIFPATDYFADGPVDVYEVYRGWFY